MTASESAGPSGRFYSTLSVAQATGIPATTIIAWERRYGMPRPQRDLGGRRRYSEVDVALLCAMRARTAEGVRAAVAARELLASEGGPPAPRPAPVYLPTEVSEVRCLHCGALSGELQVQRAPEGSQTRFVPAPGAVLPRRGRGDRPRCGRCDGALFSEPTEGRTLPPFSRGVSAAPARGAA